MVVRIVAAATAGSSATVTTTTTTTTTATTTTANATLTVVAGKLRAGGVLHWAPRDGPALRGDHDDLPRARRHQACIMKSCRHAKRAKRADVDHRLLSPDVIVVGVGRVWSSSCRPSRWCWWQHHCGNARVRDQPQRPNKTNGDLTTDVANEHAAETTATATAAP